MCCQKTTLPPDCIPHMPYFTLKAEAKDLKGPWKKRYDAPGGDSMSHMGRDIGLAWIDLPLTPPSE
jgi:hypothetical protein